jgi:hypothetical protein
MSSVAEEAVQPPPVIQINHEQIHKHLDEVVRESVETTLNALLEAEADELCGARRYERSTERVDTRAGHYSRTLQTRAGEVELKMPKLRHLPFETAIIERYRRRETSVEEALVEMYLAGVSTRRIEDITEALWGTRVSSSTVSELNKKIYGQIETWRQRPIEGSHPYVFLDGIWLKRCWGGEVRNVAVLVAVGGCQGTGQEKTQGHEPLRVGPNPQKRTSKESKHPSPARTTNARATRGSPLAQPSATKPIPFTILDDGSSHKGARSPRAMTPTRWAPWLVWCSMPASRLWAGWADGSRAFPASRASRRG